MKIIITEEQKKKLFIPRKLTKDDSRYDEHNNSQPIRDGKRINQYTPDGLKTGYWEYYYPNGKLDSKGKYVNGKRDGYWEIYHDNGELYSKGNYVNGDEEGYWEYYYSSGKLMSKGSYVNGKFIKDKSINESEKKKLFIPRRIDERKNVLIKELSDKTKKLLSELNISKFTTRGRIDDYEELTEDDLIGLTDNVWVNGVNYFGFTKDMFKENGWLIYEWSKTLLIYLNTLIPQFDELNTSRPKYTGRMFRVDVDTNEISISISYNETTYEKKNNSEKINLG